MRIALRFVPVCFAGMAQQLLDPLLLIILALLIIDRLETDLLALEKIVLSPDGDLFEMVTAAGTLGRMVVFS